METLYWDMLLSICIGAVLILLFVFVVSWLYFKLQIRSWQRQGYDEAYWITQERGTDAPPPRRKEK